jgi:hypothetical protein
MSARRMGRALAKPITLLNALQPFEEEAAPGSEVATIIGHAPKAGMVTRRRDGYHCAPPELPLQAPGRVASRCLTCSKNACRSAGVKPTYRIGPNFIPRTTYLTAILFPTIRPRKREDALLSTKEKILCSKASSIQSNLIVKIRKVQSILNSTPCSPTV